MLVTHTGTGMGGLAFPTATLAGINVGGYQLLDEMDCPTKSA